MEFEVGDHVFLKISPMKGVTRFGKKGKLAPRYIGPFEILEKVNLTAYKLALPLGLGYEEKPIRIVDRQVKQLRSKSIPMVKVE